jgi:Rrf2 family protein
MISQTAEYCLRAVLCLASERPAGGSRTTQEVAEATRIPSGYLSKIMQSLARAGLVKAQRGLNGGFMLTRDPVTLTLLDVVRVADPCRRITTCPLGIHGTELCALHRQLDHAAAVAEEALAQMTVADLMETSSKAPVAGEGGAGGGGCHGIPGNCEHQQNKGASHV